MIGGDGIEGLLISPKQLPFKYIEVCVFDAYITRIYDYSAKNAMLTMARTHTLTQANVYLCVFVFGSHCICTHDLLFLPNFFLLSLSGRSNVWCCFGSFYKTKVT